MAESREFRLLEGHRRWFWVTAVLVAGLDQLSKYALAQPADILKSQIDLLPFLRLVRRPLNTQGPFSLGPHSAIFYIIATAAGLLLIFYLFLDSHPRHLLPIVALGMLCGGALGNLIDRLAMGGVRDFIDLHWMGRSLWPTFNLADTAICIGVVLIVPVWRWGYRPPQGDAPPEKPGKAADSRP